QSTLAGCQTLKSPRPVGSPAQLCPGYPQRWPHPGTNRTACGRTPPNGPDQRERPVAAAFQRVGVGGAASLGAQPGPVPRPHAVPADGDRGVTPAVPYSATAAGLLPEARLAWLAAPLPQERRDG